VSSLGSQLSAIIGTSSVAQFLERLRTEPSWRPLSSDVVASTTVAEPEPSVQGRVAVGLLLLGAASSRRS
jgi:hypothetical protein